MSSPDHYFHTRAIHWDVKQTCSRHVPQIHVLSISPQCIITIISPSAKEQNVRIETSHPVPRCDHVAYSVLGCNTRKSTCAHVHKLATNTFCFERVGVWWEVKSRGRKRRTPEGSEGLVTRREASLISTSAEQGDEIYWYFFHWAFNAGDSPPRQPLAGKPFANYKCLLRRVGYNGQPAGD